MIASAGWLESGKLARVEFGGGWPQATLAPTQNLILPHTHFVSFSAITTLAHTATREKRMGKNVFTKASVGEVHM